MTATNSPALDAPLRTRERAALDAARMALNAIKHRSTEEWARDVAGRALVRIDTLVPEIEQ